MKFNIIMKKIKSLSLSLAIIMAAGLCTPCSGMSIFKKKKIKKVPTSYNFKHNFNLSVKITPKTMAKSFGYGFLGCTTFISGLFLTVTAPIVYDLLSGRLKGIKEKAKKDPRYNKNFPKNASDKERDDYLLERLNIWWTAFKKYRTKHPSSHLKKLTYLPVFVSLPISYICGKKCLNKFKEGLSIRV